MTHTATDVFRMKNGTWWPRYDHKPDACYATVQKHLHHADATLEFVENFGLVVQAGGHAGFWPLRLAKHFEKVLTFEPDPVLATCLLRNIAPFGKGIVFSEAALGRFSQDNVRFEFRASAGSGRVCEPDGKKERRDVKVKMVTLDHFHLPRCDVIILDVEGGEIDALIGAAHTIARFSPVIQLETLPRNEKEQLQYMNALGYEVAKRVGRDTVYVRGL